VEAKGRVPFEPIQDVLHRWILTGQALVGSVGALAFVFAFT